MYIIIGYDINTPLMTMYEIMTLCKHRMGSTTELLRAGSSTWEKGPLIPVEMLSPCAVAISSTSFLAIYGREIREFDTKIAGPLSRQGWREEGRWPKMVTSREFWPGCAKVDNKIVIAGGWDDSPTTHQTTDVLDLTSRTISKGGNLVTPRRLFHITTIDNNDNSETLALGGFDLQTIEKWNPETETWSELEAQLQQKRGFYGTVAAPKSLICLSK